MSYFVRDPRALGLFVWAIATCACTADPASSPVDAGTESPIDASRPPVGSPDASTAAPANLAPPTIAITSPEDGAQVGDPITVTGTAADDSGLASVFVQVGPNAPRLATTSDGFRTWSLDSHTPPGTFAILAYGYDTDGDRTSVAASVLVSRPSAANNAASPVVTITSPANHGAPRDLSVLVTGHATDDVSVVRMELRRNGELLVERPIVTEDFFADWVRLVPLLPGVTNTLVFRAYDEAGHFGESTLVLEGRAEVDRAAPMLTVTTPAEAATLNASTTAVTGSATDRLGVREVKVRVGQVFAGTGEVVFEDWVQATTSDGFANFAADLPIPSGAIVIEVRAIDVSGLSTTVTRVATNAYVAPFTEERRFPLYLRAAPNTTVTLSLDEAGTNQVINESTQRSLKLLDLDPYVLLVNSLTQIKNACGTSWQLDAENPNHNCQLTALGQTFGPPGTWENSPEYALVRLLTMTPANVVVDGTSVEGLKDLATTLSGWGLIDDFHTIMGEMLGIPQTTEIVPTAAVAAALQSGLLDTHPNTTAGTNGFIPITLYDALNDLAPLGVTLGPVGAHPGVFDPSTPPFGAVITDQFRMNIVSESNLRWLDGIDLSVGKDYIATVVDTTGPTYADVLEFDFTDPARFSIDGLVANPTADMRIRVLENSRFINACNGNDACQANLPASPYQTAYVWSTPRWQLEHTVARGAYNQYQTRQFDKSYYFTIIKEAQITVGNPEPAGWTHFWTLFGLGSPPEDQYLWELITEVGQVAMHRLPNGTSRAEGSANVAFTLDDVSVGLTANQIRNAVRPVLQAQASTLSDMLLGNYWENNGPVDFYYRRDAAGVATLFFVAASDRFGSQGYAYAKPGFFADVNLTTKLSSLSIAGSGDAAHEKLRLPVGETVVYTQDEGGFVYRLRFVVGADDTEIVCFVSRRTP